MTMNEMTHVHASYYPVHGRHPINVSVFPIPFLITWIPEPFDNVTVFLKETFLIILRFHG